MKTIDIQKKWRTGIPVPYLKKVLAGLAVLLLPGMLYSCSDTGGGDPPQEGGYESDTYIVLSSNSKMPSGGILRSQYADTPLGYGLSKLVDGNNNSKFVTPHESFYIVWSGYVGTAINFYSLTSADNEPENDPASWWLYASNDSLTWTVLDSRVGEKFTSRKEKKEFELPNSNSYKYAYLEIEANNGGSRTQIAEFSLQAVSISIDDLMGSAIGFTENPATPMGNHYANKHVTTDADRNWLSTAANEPPIPATNAASMTWKEFGVRLYPTAGTPNPSDVNQHGVGDCSAVAIFASFAYIYPDFVKSIITDHGDGTFTVAMFDPQGKPVDVVISSKFIAGINDGVIQSATGKNNVACWSTILEKAIIKWNAVYQVNTDITGIGSEHVAPLFTGNGSSFAFDRGVLNNEQLARAVTISLKQGKIIVGGFKPSMAIGNTKTYENHAYTLMHSTNPSALFSMRNPWGGNPGDPDSADGVLNIPDDNQIPRTIDLRIIEPGIASNYGSGTNSSYTPPAFAAGTSGLRVSPELLRSGM